MDMDVDQIYNLTQPSQSECLETVTATNTIQTQPEDGNQGYKTEIGPGFYIGPKDAIHSKFLPESLGHKSRGSELQYVNLESGGGDETLLTGENIVALTLSPASEKGLVGGSIRVESARKVDNNIGACERDIDPPDVALVFSQDHAQEISEFLPADQIESTSCDLILKPTQTGLDWENQNFPFSGMPEQTKLESILHKVKSLRKQRSRHLYRIGVKRMSQTKETLMEEKKLAFKRWTSPRRKQVISSRSLSPVKAKEKAILPYKGSSSKMPKCDVSDSDSDCIGETLSAFKNRLLLKKKAEALKRKASGKAAGFKKRTENSTLNRYVLQRAHDSGCVKTPRELYREPVTIMTKTPNEVARDIAKEALLEAGFTIELRPRQSREYNDSVYISPGGHVYWSLPRAWEALKQEIAENNFEIDRVRSSKKSKYNEEILYRRKMYGVRRVDKRTLKQVLLSFGEDKRLLSALKKLCNFSGTCIHDIISQVEVTNATLADILLVDLGLLRRLSSKSNGREAFEMSIPIDKKEERKWKRDIDNVSMTVLSTPTSKKVQSKQSKKALQQTLQISKIGNMSRSESVRKKTRKEKISRKVVSKITKTKSKKQVASSKSGKKARPRNGFRLEARTTNIDNAAESNVEWTVFSWMIDRGAMLEKDKIFCVDCVGQRTLKEGVVTREGILCRCCKKVYTSPGFELHATHGISEPVCDIIFSSGRSIIDHQLDAWETEINLRKTQNYVGVSADDTNDDTCILCGDGGDLICCDRCPSTFHMSCLEIDDIPEGNWYCPKCRCGICGGSVYSVKEELTMLQCNQCEHCYHTACLQSSPIVDGKVSFCGHACKKIFSGLRQLVGTPQPLAGGLSWCLLRCIDKDWETEPIDRKAIVGQHSKLAVALLLIKECFNPMIDPRTNIDMITQSMYNRWSEFDRLNYDGFYTAILEREGEIISVATIRVHGSRLAEMPLIGTRPKYRRKGMCRLLVDVIEKLLRSLQVSTFVLPAIPELFDTWIHAFGFRPLCASPSLEIKDLSLMVFPGTELLQKNLLEMSINDEIKKEMSEISSLPPQNEGGKMLDTSQALNISAGLNSSTFVTTDLIEDILANSSVISSSLSQDVNREIELNLGTCAKPMLLHQNYQIIG